MFFLQMTDTKPSPANLPTNQSSVIFKHKQLSIYWLANVECSKKLQSLRIIEVDNLLFFTQLYSKHSFRDLKDCRLTPSIYINLMF